jgi:hypothetical protein
MRCEQKGRVFSGTTFDELAQALAAVREEGSNERFELSETNAIDGQEYPSDDLMRLVEKIMGVTVKECADDVETGAAAWEYATEILGHIKAVREEGRDQVVNFLTKRSDELFNEDGGAVVSAVYNSVIREIRNLPTDAPGIERDGYHMIVRPLEWEAGITHKAEPLPGVNYIACSRFPDEEWSWWLDGDPESRMVCANEVTAKAAAQADFEKRVLSLITYPTSKGE